jgi:two-component system, cell cycle sensor histidine kinase and response regulator CckA
MIQHERKALPVTESAGRLAGGVAHDLNNILLVAQGYTDMAIAEAGPGSPVAALLREVSAANARAGRLVHDLLLLGGGGAMAPRAVDLGTAAVRAIASLPGDGAPVAWVPGAAPVAGRIDEPLFELVVHHVVSWAREAGATAVAVTAAEEQGRAALVFEPAGVALAQDAPDRLFEPYSRGEGNAKGAGLRLCVVRAVAVRLGGGARVDASVPGAPRVIVTFTGVGADAPAGAPPVAGSGAGRGPAPSPPGPGAGTGILLADDDDGLRAMALKILHSEGYTVFEARDGQDAVELFEKHGSQIGLLLLDDVMPRMGGRAALVRIRALRPGIPAILASGYAWSLDGGRGADDCAVLAKPWRPRELLALVRAQAVSAR